MVLLYAESVKYANGERTDLFSFYLRKHFLIVRRIKESIRENHFLDLIFKSVNSINLLHNPKIETLVFFIDNSNYVPKLGTVPEKNFSNTLGPRRKFNLV